MRFGTDGRRQWDFRRRDAGLGRQGRRRLGSRGRAERLGELTCQVGDRFANLAGWNFEFAEIKTKRDRKRRTGASARACRRGFLG